MKTKITGKMIEKLNELQLQKFREKRAELFLADRSRREMIPTGQIDAQKRIAEAFDFATN